jgi:DNA-damage-inducible protein J
MYARIEPEVKEQAEGLPFEVKLPSTKPVDISKLSEAELNAELEKGYADIVAGRTKPAKLAFADIRVVFGMFYFWIFLI